MKKLLSVFLFFIAITYSSKAFADSEVVSRPFVMIGLSDGSFKEFEISDNLKLVPDAEGNLNIVLSKDETSTVDPNHENENEVAETSFLENDMLDAINLDDMVSLGIAYKDVVNTSVSDNFISERPGHWTIYDINGVLIAQGDDGRPDFSRLKNKTTYIVSIGNETFKYLHLK